jgi:hypothetical protein
MILYEKLKYDKVNIYNISIISLLIHLVNNKTTPKARKLAIRVYVVQTTT